MAIFFRLALLRPTSSSALITALKGFSGSVSAAWSLSIRHAKGDEFFALLGVKTIPMEAALTLILHEGIKVPQSVSNGERLTEHTPEGHLLMALGDLLVDLGGLRRNWVL